MSFEIEPPICLKEEKMFFPTVFTSEIDEKCRVTAICPDGNRIEILVSKNTGLPIQYSCKKCGLLKTA